MSITRDSEFMPEVLERVYDLADEIVVADGPYAWLEEAYAGLGLDWSPEEIFFRGKRLQDHSKVRYFTGPWPDQSAKRIFAYEQCRGAVIMQLDVDELVSMDIPVVERFLASDFSIGRFHISNLVRSYAQLGNRASDPRREWDGGPLTSKLFKRRNVSPAEHLDHMWLMYVGERSTPRRGLVMRDQACGRVAHLTQMRRRTGQLVKYLYYRAGYQRTKGTPDPILRAGGWTSYGEMLCYISREEYEDLFLRMGLESLRCPQSFIVLPYEESDPGVRAITEPLDDVLTDYGTYLPRPLPLLPGAPVFSYLRSPSAGASIGIATDGADRIFVMDHVIRYNADNRGVARQADVRSFGKGMHECRLEEVAGEDIFARLLSVHLPKDASPARLFSIEEAPIARHG